jgi:4-hydroxybenzoate polyprenyltransferase
METSLLLDLPFNTVPFYILVFSATLGQYNIHYYIKKEANADSDRFLWSISHKNIHLILNIIGAVGLLFGLFHLKYKHLMVLAIIALITLLYSFPVLPFKRKKRLKDFGLLKILTLCYVWTLITVWFPVSTLTRITPGFELVFAQRFVFMFVLCLAFDIRDMALDGRQGIRTIPVALGTRRSYLLMYAGLVVFLILSVFHFRYSGKFMLLNGMIVSALATYFTIEFSKVRNSDLFYLACIDGMMLLQAMLVFIGSVGG